MVAQAILIRRQADGIEAAFEAWRLDPEANGKDLAALLAAAVHLADQMKRWQADSWSRLFAGNRSFDFQSQGSRLSEAYRLCLGIFDRLDVGVETAGGQGPVGEEVEALHTARKSLAAGYTDFQARWPLFTVEELEEGAAEIARGECVTLEEAIRELDAPPRL
jgi:hypothetical protein